MVNSVAYRSLGLEFELWSHASLGVTSLYLQHFEYLLSTSKHARFNLLRTFQKSAMVRKLLFTLRSGLFDPAVVSIVVGESPIRSSRAILMFMKIPCASRSLHVGVPKKRK